MKNSKAPDMWSGALLHSRTAPDGKTAECPGMDNGVYHDNMSVRYASACALGRRFGKGKP